MATCFYYSKLKDAEVQVIGLSVDPPEFASTFAKKVLEELPEGKVPDAEGEDFPFQLLCDTDKTVIERFGLKENNPRMGVIAIPATLLIDDGGAIRWIYESRVYTERPSVEEMLSAIGG